MVGATMFDDDKDADNENENEHVENVCASTVLTSLHILSKIYCLRL